MWCPLRYCTVPQATNWQLPFAPQFIDMMPNPTLNYTHLTIFPNANFLDTLVVHLKKLLYLLFTMV